jgi:hypothetical protein
MWMLSGPHNFSGSALPSLNLTVANYADLMKMIRGNYSGQLADALEMEVGS